MQACLHLPCARPGTGRAYCLQIEGKMSEAITRIDELSGVQMTKNSWGGDN